MRVGSFILFFSLSLFALAQSVYLKEINGKQISEVQLIAGSKLGVVYFFLSPECPLCQGYTLTIKQLEAKYHKEGITMVGIIQSNEFSVQQIKAYQKKYALTLPLYLDEEKKLASKYGIRVTPEVLFLDKKGMQQYQGRIDNWAYDIGKKRKVITEFDLDLALNQYVHQQKITTIKTKAIGCFIN